ncbi:hypothetical protein [Rurimicrobium arvi]|uniref:Uncharacterized protein n=1 Tax=Rurimicrobium arvi TaxID=2049916 RepID=A0ABP8MYQ0_9BACT
MKITYKTTGFLLDAEYTADLLNLLRGYANRFPQLDFLHLEVRELPYPLIGRDLIEPFEFIKEEKKLVVRLTAHKYYDQKGKETGKPGVGSVFEKIRFMLNKAIEMFEAEEM